MWYYSHNLFYSSNVVLLWYYSSNVVLFFFVARRDCPLGLVESKKSDEIVLGHGDMLGFGGTRASETTPTTVCYRCEFANLPPLEMFPPAPPRKRAFEVRSADLRVRADRRAPELTEGERMLSAEALDCAHSCYEQMHEAIYGPCTQGDRLETEYRTCHRHYAAHDD